MCGKASRLYRWLTGDASWASRMAALLPALPWHATLLKKVDMSSLHLTPLARSLAGVALLTGLVGAQTAALAQETGRVISSTPVIQQVAVPRQVCTQSQVATQGQKSGAGALMGAIAGGTVGNNIGGGSGRTAATMLGVLGGAVLGDKIEGAPAPEVRTVQNCTNQVFYENRTTGYHVVYEFAGKQYTVQMPHDPGPTLRLQITPVATPPMTTYPATPLPVPAGSPMPVPPPGSAPNS
jgi:uncharacterized protein YcfJ